MYNINKIIVSSQSYLKSRIMSYAQRPQKHTNCLRGKQFNTLWRIIFNLYILQKVKSKMAFTKSYKISPKASKIPNSRIYSDTYLYNHPWDKTNREQSFFADQRIFQKDNRSEKSSGSNSYSSIFISSLLFTPLISTKSPVFSAGHIEPEVIAAIG